MENYSAITFIIIGMTCLFSIPAFQNRELFGKFLFNPYIIHRNKEWWRFFTHAFVHADWMHLIVNMYSMYLFGLIVEETFVDVFGTEKGVLFFILLYVGGIMLSSYPSFEKHKNNAGYNAVGASGAVSAVVFSSILVYPQMTLALLFLPIPMPGWIFGILYLTYSWYMGKKGTDNIGHDAHFWGAVFGIVFTATIKPAFVISFLTLVGIL